MASKVVNLKSATPSPEERPFFAAQAGVRRRTPWRDAGHAGDAGRGGGRAAAERTRRHRSGSAGGRDAPAGARGATRVAAAGAAAGGAGGGGAAAVGGRGGAHGRRRRADAAVQLTRSSSTRRAASRRCCSPCAQGHLERPRTVLLDAGAGREPGQRRRQDQPAADGGRSTATSTSPTCCSSSGANPKLASDNGVDAALRRAQRPVGAARALSAAARLPAAEDCRYLELMKRCSTRAPTSTRA